ncbi:sulfotransferase [Aestuariirhabdus sp. LZHN29]|uniref:sulfotransferase n=1 Tax=Aestuariirhabdus sp. LZHN29 TaxID=3417462 RepID=UPI003CFB7347
MPSSFELFKKQLDDAVGLIENASVAERDTANLPASTDLLVDTQSLIARCESVSKKHQKTKPTLRIIHHLACSGGTLISKCISAMPNVYLLSEVHPFTDLALGKDKPKYAPSDIASLAKYAGVPKQKDLAGKLFKQSINQVYQHVETQGGILVLRDHTHADFNTTDQIPEKSALIELLEEDYEIKSVLTLRDPIDSYASLVKNGWVHFEPQSFDEYCRRLLLLLKQFNPDQIFKYEDFLKTPQGQMQSISKALDLPFDETFEDVFGMFKVTGDSGRSADVIGKRERIAPEDILKESEKSEFYKKFRAINFCSSCQV